MSRLVMLSVLVVGMLGNRAHAAVIISNASTSVTVNGGEAANGLVPYDGYFRYTDLISGEETSWSIDPVLIPTSGPPVVLSDGTAGGFGSPTDIGGGVVESLVVSAGGSGIGVRARTTLLGTTASTIFDFFSAFDMTGTKFLFHAENDLFGFTDDVAAFTGSIAGGDLALYQYDSVAGGLTVKLEGIAGPGAALTLFGSGLYSGFGSALESGDLSVLSSDGSNFVDTGDLGLALAFALSGHEASLRIDYSTVGAPPAAVPEPSSLFIFAIGALGLWGGRRRHFRRLLA